MDVAVVTSCVRFLTLTVGFEGATCFADLGVDNGGGGRRKGGFTGFGTRWTTTGGGRAASTGKPNASISFRMASSGCFSCESRERGCESSLSSSVSLGR